MALPRSTDPLQTASLIGASFRLYRAFTAGEMRDRLRGVEQPDAGDLIRGASDVYSLFLPRWVSRLIPVVTTAWKWTADGTGYPLPSGLVEELAHDYATNLTGQLDEATVKAAVKGFSALVNRKVPAKLAAANVIDAWGISSRSVKTLVVMLTGDEKARLSDLILPSVKKLRAKRFVESAIFDRATVIGEQEAWNLKEQAKQLAWTVAQRRGRIAPEARKVWQTAEDERVCPICGPLQGRAVPIEDPFPIPGGKIWSPPVHVNCRCIITLVERNLRVVKSEWEPREHPRDPRTGEFVESPTEDIDLEAAMTDALIREAAEREEQVKPGGLQHGGLQHGGLRRKGLGQGGLQHGGLRGRTSGLQHGGLQHGGLTHPGGGLTHPQTAPLSSHGTLHHKSRLAGEIVEEDLKPGLSDLLGQVVNVGPPPKKPSDKRHAGWHRSEKPMYALIDQRGVFQENEAFFLDVEVTANPATLHERIAEYQAEQDRRMVETLWERNSPVMQLGDGEYGINEDEILKAIAWQRAVYETEQDLPDPDIEVNKWEEFWTATGEKLTERDYADIKEYPVGQKREMVTEGVIDGRMVPVTLKASTISFYYNLNDYVARSRPTLVETYMVQGNDVDHDRRGFPYAYPSGRSRYVDSHDVEINGRIYRSHIVEPVLEEE